MAWTSTNANTRLALGQTSTLKTINGISLLGDGDITVATSAAGSGNEVQYRANDGTFAAALGSSVDTLGVATLSGLKLASGSYPTYLDTQYIPTYNFLALTRNGNNVGLRVAEFYSSTGSTNKVMAHPTYGLRIASDRALEFSSTSEVTGSADAKITRATGPYIKVQADSGFSVRNLADTQYASGTALAWYGSDYVQGATRVLVGNSSGGRLLPGTDGLQVYNWAQSGLGYLQAGSFYVGGTAGSGDVLITRNATGPAAQIQAAGGLNIKNFAGTAPGALDVGNITSYNSTYPSGTISTRLPDGTGVFSGGGTFGTGFSATKSQAIEFKNHAGTSKFGMGIDDSDGFYISGPSKNKAMVMHPTYGIGLISDGQVFTTCSSFSVIDTYWNNYALAYLGRLRLNTGDFNTTGAYSLSASEIWSNAAVTFSSNTFAVTDAGSLAGSKLVDFRSDNVSRVSINKVASAANHTAPFRLTFADTVSLAYSPEYGKLTLRNAANTADASLYLSSIQATSDINVTSYISVSNHSEMGSSSWRGAGRAMTVASGGGYHFSSTTSVGGTADVGFYRNAAGVVEVNSGTINAYRDMKLRSLITTGGTLPSSGGMGTDGLAIGLSGLTTYGIGANGNAEPVIVTNSVHTATLGRNIKIPSDGSYGFTGVTNANQNSSADVLLTRSATGPALQVQSAGGLNVKNLAGTSDAGIVASSIASSSGTFTVNAAATSVQLNVAGTNRFSVQSGASYSINNLLPFGTYDLGNSTGNAWRSLYLDSTVTTSTPAINLAQTWNGTGVTFTGIKSNITDTLSANGSLLLDLQVGSVSKFSVDKYGNAIVNNLTVNGTSNITATPGGSSGQLQYNNGGVFGGITGSVVYGDSMDIAGTFTAGGSIIGADAAFDTGVLVGDATTAGTVTFPGSSFSPVISRSLAGDYLTVSRPISIAGTVTTSTPAIDASQTWNNVATTFTGIKFNATDTTSATASKLIDLQVGGVSKFNVDKAGSTTIATGQWHWLAGSNIGLSAPDLNTMLFSAAGTSNPRMAFHNAHLLTLADAGKIGWTSSSAIYSAPTQDAFLARNATGPAVQVQAAGGLKVTNLAGSAGAPFTASTGTFSGNVNTDYVGRTTTTETSVRFTSSEGQMYAAGVKTAYWNQNAIYPGTTGSQTLGLLNQAWGAAEFERSSYYNNSLLRLRNRSGGDATHLAIAVCDYGLTNAFTVTHGGVVTSTSNTVTSGTIASSTPSINATQTWNNVATTFTGHLLNITDTASASASKLIDLQVGGTTNFNVLKGGYTYSKFGFHSGGTTSTIKMQADNNGLGLVSDGVVSWAPAASYSSLGDVFNVADAKILRNTTGQLDVRADSGLRIRNLANTADANLQAAVGTFGAVTVGTTTLSAITMGNASIAQFVGALYLGSASGQMVHLAPSGVARLSIDSASCTVGVPLTVQSSATIAAGTVTTSTPIINATQTWNNVATTFTGHLLNITDTASAATSKLLDLQVGSVSKFSVDKAGNTVLNNLTVNGTHNITVTPGGSSGNLQYNNAGSLGGISGSSVSGSDVTLGGNLSLASNASFSFGSAVGSPKFKGSATRIDLLRNDNTTYLDLWLRNMETVGSVVVGTTLEVNDLLTAYTDVEVLGNANLSTTSALQFGVDAKLVRNATGPAVQVQAAGGLNVKNLAGSADGPLTASTGTFSTGATIQNSGSLNLASGASSTYLQQSGVTLYVSNYGGSGSVTRFSNNSIEGLRLSESAVTAYLPVTLTAGTATTSSPVINATQTWNNVATTFTGHLLNITDTASATASKLLDLQVGSSSKFAVKKDGSLTIAGDQPTLTIAQTPSVDPSNNIIYATSNGKDVFKAQVQGYSGAASGFFFGAGATASPTAAQLSFTIANTVAGGVLISSGTSPLLIGTGGARFTAGYYYNEFPGSHVFNGGTNTASTPLQFNQTWNNAAIAFTGIQENITLTAASASSKYLDLQKSGTSQFYVGRGSMRLAAEGYEATNYWNWSVDANNPILTTTGNGPVWYDQYGRWYFGRSDLSLSTQAVIMEANPSQRRVSLGDKVQLTDIGSIATLRCDLGVDAKIYNSTAYSRLRAGNTEVYPQATTDKGLLVKLQASHTANPFEIQRSDGTANMYFKPGGGLTVDGASIVPTGGNNYVRPSYGFDVGLDGLNNYANLGLWYSSAAWQVSVHGNNGTHMSNRYGDFVITASGHAARNNASNNGGHLILEFPETATTAKTFKIRRTNYTTATDIMTIDNVSGMTYVGSVGVTPTSASNVPLTLNGVTSQTANLLEAKNVGGSVVLSASVTGAVYSRLDDTAAFQVGSNSGIVNGVGSRFGNNLAMYAVGVIHSVFDNSGFYTRSDRVIGFAANTSPYTNVDTAIGRDSAGVMQVNNGTLNTYRDLKLRSLISSNETVTSSTPILNLTQTWNSGATTFKAITLDVTDTTSASASKFLDFSLGGTSKFSVDKNGNVSLNNLTVNGTHNITMTATPGGTSGQIQYNNGGSLGGMSGSTISGSNMTLTGTFGATSATLTGGTITTSTPAVTATQTWNNVATTFTGLSLDVTDTASASGSKLADLMVGGSTKFSIDKAGNTVTGNQLTLTPSDTFGTTRITAGNYGTLSLGLNGGYLAVAGTSSLLYTASQFSPVNNNAVDLGQTGTRFKDAYLQGTLYTNTGLSITGELRTAVVTVADRQGSPVLRANSDVNANMLVASYNTTTGTKGFLGGVGGWANMLGLGSDMAIGFSSLANDTPYNLSNAVDAKIVRANTGLIDIRANSGFRVRTLDNSAYAGMSVGSLSSSGLVVVGDAIVTGTTTLAALTATTGTFSGALTLSQGQWQWFNTGIGIQSPDANTMLFTTASTSNPRMAFHNSQQLTLGSGGSFGWASSSSFYTAPTQDALLARNATGPAVQVQAAGGLAVRDLAGTSLTQVLAGQYRLSNNNGTNYWSIRTGGSNFIVGNSNGTDYLSMDGSALRLVSGHTLAFGTSATNADVPADVTYGRNATGPAAQIQAAGGLNVFNLAASALSQVTASKFTADSFGTGSGDSALVIETFTDPANTSVKAARLRTASSSRRLYIGDSSSKFYALNLSGCTTLESFPNVNNNFGIYGESSSYPVLHLNNGAAHAAYQKVFVIRNNSGYDIVSSGPGNLSTDGGIITLWPGVISQTDYCRMEYNAGNPRIATTRTNLSINASGGLKVCDLAGTTDTPITSSSIGPSSNAANFRINVPTYGATTNYSELYFNNTASYDSYFFFNAAIPFSGGTNNFGIRYRNNGQADFGVLSANYINFQPSSNTLIGSWNFPTGANYPAPKLCAATNSGSEVYLAFTRTGVGAGQTIQGYATTYALTGIPTALDLRAKSIQLGAYTDASSSHAWNDYSITNKVLIDSAGLTVTGNVLTATHNTYDIGTTGTRFKDAYLQGNITTAGSVIATNYIVGSSTGPMIKNNAGSVRFRDYLDSTYAGLEAGTGTFSGSVTAGTFTAVNGSTGRVMVVTGDATYSGYIEWRNPANSPKWYMGYDSGNDITLAPFASGSVNIGTSTYTGSVKLIGSASNATISVSTGSSLNVDKPLSVTGGTVTTSTPVFDSTQTWNNVATTFTGIKANITDTASASGSLLLDLQVGGTSKASINKLGAMTLASTLTVGNSTFASVNLGGSASLNQVFGSTVFTGTAVSLSPGGVARLSASSTSVDITTPMTQSIGTVTSTTPAISVIGTWNNVSTSFTGLKFDFTDTASASTSKLLDLQVGSVTKFSVDKAGNTVLNNLTVNGTHNITASAGGSSGQLQYNNAGVLGGITSSSVSGANLTLGGTLGFTTATATGGTVTTSTPLLSGTQTWNAAGQTFKAIYANITDTASGSGSLLLDLQVGGTSYLSATKAGLVTAPTFSASAASTGYLNICKGDGSNSGYIEWRNQSNTRKWYMGYDSTNDLTLMPESSGSLKIGSATYTGSVKLVGSSSTATVAVTTGSSVSVDKDVAITGAVSATYATLATGSISSSTPAVNVTQTWNNVATTFTAIKANVTDTTSASASLLMDLQVGSVSKFSVDKSGTTTSAVFYSGAGSQGVPGIMIGEASTGFYRNAASTLRMTLGGTVPHGWNTSGFETTGYIGFTTASPGSAIHDALIARNNTGPTIDVRAAGGLKVRNFAGTNDAPLTASTGTFSSTIAVSDTTTTADRFTFKDDGATTWTLSTGGVASTDGFRFTKLGVADIVAFRPSVCVHYTPLTTTGLLTATSGLFAKSDTTWADANIPTVTVQNTATSGSRTAVIKAKIDTGYTGALPELWMGAETAVSGITGTFVRTVSNHPMIFYTNDVKRFELTAAGHIVPSTTNVTDLGLTGTRFKDAYLQGTVYSNGFNAGNGSITVHRDGPLYFGSDALVRYNLSTTAVQAQAASGLKVRNYADSADAPITASNGIFTNKAAIGTSAVANAMLYISDSQPSSYPTIAIDKYTWGSPLSLNWATESAGITSTGAGALFSHTQTITTTSLANSPVNGGGLDVRCEYDQPYVAGIYVRGRKTRTDAPTHPNLAYGIYAVANSGKASGLGGAAGYFLCETANVAGVQIRAAASQAQSLLLVQDSAAATLFSVDQTGNVVLNGYSGLTVTNGSCVINQDGNFQIGTHAKLKRATNDLKVCAPVTYFRNYADSADAAINAGAATLTGQLKLPVDTQVISSESQNRIYFANSSHTYYAVPAGSAHVFREGSSSNRGAVEALKVTTKNNSSTTTNLLKDVGGIEAYPQGTTDAGILVTMPASSTAKALEVIMSATSNFSVSSSGVVISKFDTKAGATVVGDLATSTIRTIKDTTGGKTRIYINDGGTLKQSLPFIADAGSTGWTISNFTTHKTLDPTTTTMTELINFIATLAQRLKDLGAIDA